MAFRRENGRVYLDLSVEDFDALLFSLGVAAAHPERSLASEGNPQWTPYALDDDPPAKT